MAWLWYRGRRSGSGNGGGGDSSIGLLLHTFKLEYMLLHGSSPLVLGLLVIDFEDLHVLLLCQVWV